MRTINLISLYYYVCQLYDEELYLHCFRHTKNGKSPVFTDQELITIFLFIQSTYKPSSLKALHAIAQDAYLDWFPCLPGYERFSRRLNRISSVFGHIANDLSWRWFSQCLDSGAIADEEWLLNDSFPVVTCAGNRYGIVAPEITDRGYNSTKRMHFWGVKVHVLAYKVSGSTPVPVRIWVGPASEHDYQAQVTELESVASFNISGDKAFESKELIQEFKAQGGKWMIGKKDNYRKRESERQRNIAADKLYNRAVSKLKQPIESLFSTFAKFGIQRASLIRSTAGLTRHIMGTLAAAMIETVVFNVI